MGKFYTKDDLPYFSPDDSHEFEIQTSQYTGMKLENGIPEVLQPNVFYYLGEIEDEVELRFAEGLEGYLAVYRGEYKILNGGRVIFPSQIRWVESEEGCEGPCNADDCIYQFEIVNGIGSFRKVFDGIPT